MCAPIDRPESGKLYSKLILSTLIYGAPSVSRTQHQWIMSPLL